MSSFTPTADQDARAAEIATKLDRVNCWLLEAGYEAALFASQPGVAWATAGLEDRIARNEEPGQVWVLVDEAGGHLLTTNVEEPRLTSELDVESLGFKLHVSQWYRPGGLADLAAELTADRRLANDGYGPGRVVSDRLAALRMPLVPQEHNRLAVLGSDCANALEGALRAWTPDQKETEVAARIAGALEELTIFPSVLLVGGYERRRRFKHPVPTDSKTGMDVLAVIVGVRGGLNIACTRTASAGTRPEDLERHRAACSVEAAMIAATRPATSWESVLEVGKRAYAAAGFPDEWKVHWQGGPIAYNSREYDVVPGTAGAAATILLGSAFAWNPTVQGGKSEDTFIVTADRARPVSNTAEWPELTIETDDDPIARPAILSI
ncbi:MAG: hypothetical protein ABSD85_17135 [Acidimicrobiales bacterium]|jgi:antitoxin VapB